MNGQKMMDTRELKTYEGGYLSAVQSPVITPVTKWLNPRLIFVDDTSLECEYVVRPEMADPPGWLHGGIRAAMLCDMLGVFANFLGDRKPAITTTMSVDFIGKAFIGEKVRLVAEVVNRGGSLIYMSGKIFNEQRQIVARGSSSLFILTRYKETDTP